MARIRSIHPNTPIDPELASLPVEARLLFIYSWTAADDAGNLEGNPLGLRMALFPADDWATVARITELAEMLIAGRFYESYEADGKQYLHVRNFPKYQKLDHPTAPKFPLAPGQSYTYHVRQGNTYVPRTENGPPLIPRTAPEQHTNVSVPLVCRSRRNGMDRTGLDRKGKDLDWIGKDRRGPGRKGKRATASAGALRPPLASPLQQGADRGNGTPEASWKGNGVKESALNEVARLVSTREIDLAGASDKLRNTYGFTPSEINEPALLTLLQRAAEGGAT